MNFGSRLGWLTVMAGALGFYSSAQPSKMLKVDDSFNGKEVTLEVGEALEIAVAENATTGFRWSVKSKPDELQEFEETEPAAQPAPRTPGRGSVHRFYFRAIHRGAGELELQYRRSWETKAPARVYKLRVQVRG